ncbi:hypothetical protein O9993_06740 [Vibrio lentus]|nr:hypothetical protein [Vibrio lentus]
MINLKLETPILASKILALSPLMKQAPLSEKNYRAYLESVKTNSMPSVPITYQTKQVLTTHTMAF